MKEILELYFDAEKNAKKDTAYCSHKLRILIEILLKKIYFQFGLQYPGSLYKALEDSDFKQKMNNESIINIFHHIRKTGNKGAHENSKLRQEEMQIILNQTKILLDWYKNLFQVEFIDVEEIKLKQIERAKSTLPARQKSEAPKTHKANQLTESKTEFEQHDDTCDFLEEDDEKENLKQKSKTRNFQEERQKSHKQAQDEEEDDWKTSVFRFIQNFKI